MAVFGLLGVDDAADSANEGSQQELHSRLSAEGEIVPCPKCNWKLSSALLSSVTATTDVNYRAENHITFSTFTFVFRSSHLTLKQLPAW